MKCGVYNCIMKSFIKARGCTRQGDGEGNFCEPLGVAGQGHQGVWLEASKNPGTGMSCHIESAYTSFSFTTEAMGRRCFYLVMPLPLPWVACTVF